MLLLNYLWPIIQFLKAFTFFWGLCLFQPQGSGDEPQRIRSQLQNPEVSSHKRSVLNKCKIMIHDWVFQPDLCGPKPVLLCTSRGCVTIMNADEAAVVFDWWGQPDGRSNLLMSLQVPRHAGGGGQRPGWGGGGESHTRLVILHFNTNECWSVFVSAHLYLWSIVSKSEPRSNRTRTEISALLICVLCGCVFCGFVCVCFWVIACVLGVCVFFIGLCHCVWSLSVL